MDARTDLFSFGAVLYEVEAELPARARRTGVPVSQYVQRILEQHLPVQPVQIGISPEQRAKAFQDWVQNFPYRRNEPVSDDATSRESFYYQGDGE